MSHSCLLSALSRLQPCLVVEDDSIIILDLEHTLRQLGMSDLRLATSLAKAETFATANDIRFAILDYSIGRTNTLEIAEALVVRGTPVLFLTAYGEDMERPAALAHVPVLAKPFTTAQLAASLELAAAQRGGACSADQVQPSA